METYSLFFVGIDTAAAACLALTHHEVHFCPILAFGAMMDLQNTAQAPTNFCVKNPLKTLLQAQLHGCIA